MCSTTSKTHTYVTTDTVRLINFEDKIFRGFRGDFLNHEIKYSHNFL